MAATGDVRAVDPTIGALGDGDRIVRVHATRALGLLKADRAAGALVERMKDPREDIGVRGAPVPRSA